MIPSPLYLRWSPMWVPDHVRSRPWWRRGDTAFIRCDGRTVPIAGVVRTARVLSVGPSDPALDRIEMEKLDREHPLHTPPPMPGQVWARPGEHGLWIEDEITRVSFTEEGTITAFTHPGKPWQREAGAILVAGPTPWGRDVPWAGVAS